MKLIKSIIIPIVAVGLHGCGSSAPTNFAEPAIGAASENSETENTDDDVLSAPNIETVTADQDDENRIEPVDSGKPSEPLSSNAGDASSTDENTDSDVSNYVSDNSDNNAAESNATDSPEGIIFETDFSNDSGYFVESIGLWNGGYGVNVPLPEGWTGVKATIYSKLSVESGVGLRGGNALKVEWDPDASQPTVSLAKHLTGDETTGYDELYIRYHVKLPNNFMMGFNGSGVNYWKWGRLWQNTSIDNSSPNKWTENRNNSGRAVWNFKNNPPYTIASATFAASDEAVRPRYKVDFFDPSTWDGEKSPGAFQAYWDIDTDSRPGELVNNTTQTYHTIEYRIKLSSSIEAADGVFEMWFDGVPQGGYERLESVDGAPEVEGIATPVMGSGFNFFVMFDNMSGWNARWSDPDYAGFIYVDDVVVSTEYIGHNYRVGD